MDWAAWSRESVAVMDARTRELFAQHRIDMGSKYHWDLDAAALVIGDVVFRLVTVGTVVGDSFLWAWNNDSLPASAKVGIDKVRRFGVENDLGLLSEPCARRCRFTCAATPRLLGVAPASVC